MSGYADLSRAAYISPNDLMNSTRVNYYPQELQLANQNALLTSEHNQQVIDATSQEHFGRAALGLAAIGKPGPDPEGEAERAAAYPAAVAALPPSLRGRAPAQYMGWAGLQQVAALAVPAEKQYLQGQNREGFRQIFGDGTTAPGTVTSSVATPPAQPGAMQTTTTTEPETGLPVLNRTAPAAAPGTATRLADIHPNLTSIQSRGGAKLTVAADAAPRFQGLIDDLEAAGYSLDPATTGGYNARNIAGTNTPSQHAYGSAIDINWQRNARGANTPSDIPPELARSLAAKHGLTWGGDWTGDTRDPMHFEVARSGAQAPARGVAARTGGTDVAGPGAGPGATPTPPATGGGGMLAGLTPDQQRMVRALEFTPNKGPADALQMIQHFKEQNAALAHQTFEEQRQARTEAATAAQREVQNQREAETLKLSQEAGKRAADDAAQKAKEAAKPFHGTGMDPQDQNILDAGDDGSARYARAYTRVAAPRYHPDGSFEKPNMLGYDKPSFIPKGMTEAPDYTKQEQPVPTIMNNEQSKAAGFADRIQQALPVITDTSDAAMSRWQILLGKAPLGNSFVSPEFQLHQQSERNFINATLRRESGMAISESEFVNARQQYIPQPGDKPPVLAQKAQNRKTLMESMIRDAGPAYKPKADIAPTTNVPPPPPGFTVVQ